MSVVQTEKRILAIALSDAGTLPAIFSALRSDDFLTPANRTLFTLVQGLYLKGDSVDVDTLRNAIAKHGQGVVSVDDLAELLEMYTTSSGLESYVNIIKDASIRDKLRRFAKRVEDATSSPQPINEITWKLEQELLDISLHGRSVEFRDLKTVTRNVYDRIKRLEKRDKPITGIPSGFEAIDAVTNGFQPGELVILAARPGMGKTAFALNLIVNAAKELRQLSEENRGVVVAFSLEMGAEQLVSRMLSSESQIGQSDLRMGNVHGRWTALMQAIEELENLEIVIDDSTSLTILDIYAKLKKLSTTKKVKMVVIDYLQLLRGDSGTGRSRDNRQQEVAQISRLLKSYAREFGVPFIVLAQLNREAERRGSSRPLLADLRESGAIEQDADIVSFLITPNNYANTLSNAKQDPEAAVIDSSKAEYIIAKNRNGPTKDIPLMVDLSTGTFGNWGS